MKTLVVICDLNKVKNYPRIITELRKLNGRHIQKSAWLVTGDFSCPTLESKLRAYVDADDTLDVFEFVDRAGNSAPCAPSRLGQPFLLLPRKKIQVCG